MRTFPWKIPFYVRAIDRKISIKNPYFYLGKYPSKICMLLSKYHWGIWKFAVFRNILKTFFKSIVPKSGHSPENILQMYIFIYSKVVIAKSTSYGRDILSILKINTFCVRDMNTKISVQNPNFQNSHIIVKVPSSNCPRKKTWF